ncbi:hypothetical protein J7F03_00120 [Streptomyces sp. ISL-43]|uniref:hypothetical protein n=1 Tax=Streptomyces sp. ISL-43 TaxID=2819183 RepID=UPI001BE73012|nr:hypothetical protein [Streptomyces sp. ISL-43]MBT2445528.1 hypothetical protein [Streptomyces sp. ISL-43]
MRSKLAGIVGVITLGLTAVLGATTDLGWDFTDQPHIQADTHGPGSPAPAPAARI